MSDEDKLAMTKRKSDSVANKSKEEKAAIHEKKMATRMANKLKKDKNGP